MNHEEQGFKPDNKSRDNDNSNHTPDHNQSDPQNESETEHPLAAEIRRWIAKISIHECPTFANCLKFKWAFAEKIQSQTKILYGDNRIPLAQQIKQDFDHVASVIRDFDVHCEKRCYEDDEAEILESKHQRIETLGNNLANLIAGRCRLPQSHLNSRQQERLKTETQRRAPIRIEVNQPEKKPANVPPKPSSQTPIPIIEKQDTWISYDEAAELLEMTKSTISKWASQGRFIDNGQTGQNRRLSKTSVILAKQKYEEEKLRRFGKKKD